MPGEIAEMMLDGTLCEGCGEYMGGDAGYPRRCAGCGPIAPEHKGKPYVQRDPNSNRSKKRAARAFQRALKERAERGYGSKR